ncbi:MAG TPA: hypothetical protein ENN40_01225 [Candidatus Aminicenantes bacterium]|nr:hypothetical protein [Candidatus Aminicenantes bacterium]
MNKTKSILTILIAFVLFAASSDLAGQTRTIKPVKAPISKIRLQPDLEVSFTKARPLTIPAHKINLVVSNSGKAAAGNFFVDFILSSDEKAPVTYAAFSTSWNEDMLVKGGRMHIDRLAAGASRTLSLPLPIFKPRGAPKLLYLGAVADSGQAVAESNEKNNTAFVKYQFLSHYLPQPQLIHISGVSQTTIMGSDTGNIELHLGGSGFGSTPGKKTVKLGSYTLPVEEHNGNFVGWTDTWINCLVKDNLNIPFGQTYSLRIMDGNQLVSNTIQILLKLDFEGIMIRGSSSGFILEARAGDVLELHAYKLPPVQGNWTVRFGPQTVPVTSWGPNNKISFNCPNLPPGSYQVWIRNGSVDVCLRRYNMTVLP